MKQAIVNGKKIDTSEISEIVCQGDLVDSVAFVIQRTYMDKDLSIYNFYLTFKNSEGEGEPVLLGKTVGDTTLTLVWAIGTTFTQTPGMTQIQVWAEDIVDEVTVMK